MIDNKIMTKKRFSAQVEEYVLHRRMTYIDAICEVCSDTGIDPLETNKLLVDHIIEKVEAEAMSLNMIPKKSRLPGFDDED